jgi:pimeloyl-ACP methyl ester carboxylesterase
MQRKGVGNLLSL